jgi:hypothetical protein
VSREAPASIKSNKGITSRGFTKCGALQEKDSPIFQALVERHRRFAVELQGDVQGDNVESLVDEVEK